MPHDDLTSILEEHRAAAAEITPPSPRQFILLINPILPRRRHSLAGAARPGGLQPRVVVEAAEPPQKSTRLLRTELSTPSKQLDLQ
jgi:hypothetical protein